MKTGLDRRTYGAAYEGRAEEYLKGQGYRFIERNVNYKSGEIDLIFERELKFGTELVFVEVRKKDSRGFIPAVDSVTFPKKQKLMSAVSIYLARYRGQATSVSIDLIAFENEQLTHYPGFIA